MPDRKCPGRYVNDVKLTVALYESDLRKAIDILGGLTNEEHPGSSEAWTALFDAYSDERDKKWI